MRYGDVLLHLLGESQPIFECRESRSDIVLIPRYPDNDTYEDQILALEVRLIAEKFRA